MVRVIKAKDISVRPIRALIYGEPGAGKTTLISTAPRPLLVIDFEGGADIRLMGADNIDIVPIHSRSELLEVLKWLKSQNHTYSSIAFDGFSIYVQNSIREILEERGKANATFYEWGLLSSHTRDIILGLLRPNTNVIFTALVKQKEVQENQGNGQTMYRLPDLPRFVRQQLRAITDLEGLLWMDKEGKRWLGFSAPKGGAEVKDRSGKLSEKEPPNLTEVFQKVFSKEAQK